MTKPSLAAFTIGALGMIGFPLLTAALSITVSVFAALPMSPLGWVELIVARDMGP